MTKPKYILTIMCVCIVLVLIATPVRALNIDKIMGQWTRNETFSTKGLDGTLEIKVTYYSGEYVEALVESEAEKNLWTADEKEQYKYQLLKTLNLSEYIPFHIAFNNKGSSMHMAPFDKKLTLWVGKKKLEPIDYDKRFNFKLTGERDGLVWFPRYDDSGNPLLSGVKSIRLVVDRRISPLTIDKNDMDFIWDVVDDNPEKLYTGKAAARLELDRLIKRLEKLNDQKKELEGQLAEVESELQQVQKRVEELQRQ